MGRNCVGYWDWEGTVEGPRMVTGTLAKGSNLFDLFYFLAEGEWEGSVEGLGRSCGGAAKGLWRGREGAVKGLWRDCEEAVKELRRSCEGPVKEP